MIRQIRTGAVVLVAMTVLCGFVYPLTVTGIAQVLFEDRADGSLVRHDGRTVGSSLVGQAFDGPEWFHPRPSAGGYDPLASGGTNLGPNATALLADVASRAVAYRAENGLSTDVPVPSDAVTASASGLDPHISQRNARLQAARVAQVRGLDAGVVLALVDEHTSPRPLGVLGDPGVNVLLLNLAVADASAAGR